MISREFDIQKYLRSLKEFDAIKQTDKASVLDSEYKFVESQILDKNKRIKQALSRNFSEILSEISNFSASMNSSISDTRIPDEFLIDGDEKFTPSTWGGRGDKLNIDIQNCLSALSEVVNPEISSISNFDFSDKISSIVYSQLFGKEFLIPEYTFTDESGTGLFGNFNKIFKYETLDVQWQFSPDSRYWTTINDPNGLKYSETYLDLTLDLSKYLIRAIITYPNNQDPITINFEKDKIKENTRLEIPFFISGLSFLESFTGLKSYKFDLYKTYVNGIRFTPPDLLSQENLYQESFSKDSIYLSNIAKSISKKVEEIKNALNSIIINCDEFGRYKGYEGLGNIKGQINNLRKIFKPEYFDAISNKIESDVLKVTSYSNSGSQEIFIGLSESLSKFSNNLDSLCSSISRIGSKEGEKITDRSYIYGANTRDEIVSQLKRLGFTNQLINVVLSSKDLACSFVFLYEELDEKDIYSYFKGGRLAEYLFYLGGEKAISETLDFLLSKKDIKYFFDSLDKIIKNRDYSITKNRYLYGNILGSFISLFPEAINYILKSEFKKSEKDIVEKILSSGAISVSSNTLLDKVEKNISDPSSNLSFNDILNYPSILKEFLNLLSPALGDLQDKYKTSQFLSSINGISAKELNFILNNSGGKRSYELSGFLSGIEGGRYQSLVSGLLHAVLLPKTSPALLPANRRYFTLGTERTELPLEELLHKIKDISEDISSFSYILTEVSLGSKTYNEEPQKIKSTIYSINKETSYTIRNLTERDNSSFILELRKALDAEKPGIGNSKDIDSTQQRGILTPEQAREIESLLSKTKNVKQIELNQEMNDFERIITQKDILSRWIKLDFSSFNRLNALVAKEKGPFIANNNTAEEFENIKIKLSELIDGGFINSEKSQYLNLLSPVSKNNKAINEVSICSKLGKTEEVCNKEYSSKNKISSQFGKTLKPSSIPIERPLGVISDNSISYSNSPGSTLISKLSNNRIKSYQLDIPGSKESLDVIDNLPSIIFNKNLDLNREFYNQEEREILSGLFDLTNNHLYIQKYAKTSKHSMQDCRLISDPIHKQLCVNYIKCVKFVPTKDIRYLPYCPKTTPGGRNKQNG